MATPDSPRISVSALATSPCSPRSARLKLHDSTSSIASAARNTIMHSSAKGWSPLTINKNRDSSNSTCGTSTSGTTSPILPNHTGGSISSSVAPTSPNGLGSSTTRRTSSSYRHMATNSLVAKSPFKDLKTREGALSNGVALSPDSEVIHERRSTTRALGQTPRLAYGSANTPKNAIGLGSAISGTRKVSNERKVSFPSSIDRYDDLELKPRRTSGSKENDAPRRGMPRKSLAYRATIEGERVTKSPFLSERPEDFDEESYVESPAEPPRRRGSNRRHVSPSAHLTSARASMSPSSSPQPSRVASASMAVSPLKQEVVPSGPTPTKSALASTKRVGATQNIESPSRKTVTFEPVPDVKEYELSSRDISLASIPQDDGDDEEWIDEGNVDWVGKVIRDDRDISMDSMDSGDIPVGDVSATADFMDSLIEDGFYEGTSQEEAFQDDSQFEIPMESFTQYIESGENGDDTPMASTPIAEKQSLPVPPSPQHVHIVNPHLPPTTQPDLPHSDDHSMLRTADASQPAIPQSPNHMSSPGPHAHQEGALYDPFITIQTATDVLVGNHERVENGVPLGRSSHHERVQAARMLATQKLGLGLPGAMPRSASPVHAASDSDMDSPVTQPKELESDVFGAVIASPARSMGPGRRVSGTPEYDGPSKRMAQFRASKNNTPTKSTPRRPLPPPAPIEIPSPVQVVAHSGDESETDSEAETGNSLIIPTPLPVIKGTSPLMTPMASEDDMTEDEGNNRDKDLPPVPKARVSDIAPRIALSPELEEVSQQLSELNVDDSRDQIEDADDEPLTPPPALRRSMREDSPRIPSLEFDQGLGFGPSEEQSPPATPTRATPKPVTIITAPSPSDGTPSRSGTPTTPRFGSAANSPSRGHSPVSNQSPLDTPTRSGTPARQPSPLASVVTADSDTPYEEETSIIAAEFGGNSDEFNDASTTTRIRQRISREMIRETVNQRVAAGGLSRPVSMFDGPRPSMIDAPRRRNVSPLRITPRIPKSSSQSLLDGARSPTSPTASTALQQLRNSNESPKSALDRIMNQLGKDDECVSPSDLPQSPTKVVSPARVLRKGQEPEEEDAPNVPPSVAGSIVNDPKALAAARRSRRRSASVSDAAVSRIRSPRLTLGGIGKDTDSILNDVRDEIEHIGSQRGYRVRTKSNVRVTYTGDIDESSAGNLEIGKAWRPVRRPSDMNEHSKEIRAARAREASEGKASGTIFVKVLGIEALKLPLPVDPTNFCITMDNGIDYIRTPYNVLKEGAHINQEFSLVEHKNFEFSLSLDIRRDPHIMKLVEEREKYKSALAASKTNLAASTATMASTATSSRLEPPKPIQPPRPTSPAVSLSSHRSGFSFRSLFSSPRKNRHQRTQSTPSMLSQSTSSAIPASLPMRKAAPPQAQAPTPPPESLARYLVDTGGNTIAKTHIAFKPIAKQCEAKVLEIRYPMFAMFKPDGTSQRQQVAKITIQILRLPPLPGLAPEELPGSIEDTLRGLRHHAWHLHEYNEGVLTQLGGDCRAPRRRLFRLVGGHLLAINEVTRKEVASIDLRLATRVLDLNAPSAHADDDYDPFSSRAFSFQLKFSDGEGITFSADNNEDKTVWMDTFNGLIGRIPPNPLWAEMLSEQQAAEEKERRASRGPRKSARVSVPRA